MDPSGRAFGPFWGSFIPASNVWLLHAWAALTIIAVVAAYAFYSLKSGTSSRIRFDGARLESLRRGGATRWGAAGVLLYWIFFGLIACQIGTGSLMYAGFGGRVVSAHLCASWLIVAFVAAHVAMHFAFGGLNQIGRIFRPAASTVTLPIGGFARPNSLLAPHARPARTVIALGSLAAAMAAVATFLFADRVSTDNLVIAQLAEGAAPSITDGLSDAAWRAAKPVKIRTQQGANFGGTGETTVEIRALHDRDTAWFAFTWRDPTRSLEHKPLVKTAAGWRELRQEPGLRDRPLAMVSYSPDAAFVPTSAKLLSEDKFSVMLARSAKGFGPGAFHAGERPLQDKPASSSGRGLHYREDGRSAEIWLWHAAALARARQCEHLTMGGPAEPSPEEILGRRPYKGGIVSHAVPKPVIDNIDVPSIYEPPQGLRPLRLPKALNETQAAMGRIDLSPDHTEALGVRWSMWEADSSPYSARADAAIPVGTVIPGAVSPDMPETEAGDLGCSARWASGFWTLIVSRPLHAGRLEDVDIGSGVSMWVAAFDHDPSQHTRHMRPITLELR